MLSKNKIKHFQQLSSKKQRGIFNEFLIEGTKIFKEAVRQKWDIKEVYATKDFISKEVELAEKFNIIPVDEKQLSSLGNLENNHTVLALVNIQNKDIADFFWQDKICLILDNIKDPGNLGTIIRTADWFGIHHIICSKECVDLYNPKVIQASMGAFLKCEVYITDLKDILSKASTIKDFPVFGAVLEGKSPKLLNGIKKGFLLLGSESHGISPENEAWIKNKITIPKSNLAISESLNVGVAASILCYELSVKK